MKKQILTFILLIAVVSSSFAQYNEIMKIAKTYEQQGNYYNAIVTYNAANVALDKPADNNIEERKN